MQLTLQNLINVILRMTGKKVKPVLIENAEQEAQLDASVPMTVSIAKLKELCSADNQVSNCIIQFQCHLQHQKKCFM